jgi:hypothetical protein
MSGLVKRAALGFLLLAGCEKEGSPGRTDQPWDRVELPGFSVEMPPGTDMSGPNAGTSYQAGTVKRARTGEPVHITAASWQVGALSTDEELEALGTAAAAALAPATGKPTIITSKRREAINGQPAARLTMEMEPFEMELIEVTCGGRAIQLMVAAVEATPLADRMVRSIDCHPDPVREKELSTDRAPVGFDGLTGWYKTPEPAAFTITDGTTLALFQTIPSSDVLKGDTFERAMGSLMQSFLGSWTAGGSDRPSRHGNTRQVVYGRSSSEGEPIDVAATLWACAGGITTVGMVIHPTSVPRETAIDVLFRARCLAEGEAPPTLPPPPPDMPIP